jgi:hypothetical protein
MARRNFPNVTPDVVQHGSGWAIWLAVILGGALGVFALTALMSASLFRADFLQPNGYVGKNPGADRTGAISNLRRI